MSAIRDQVLACGQFKSSRTGTDETMRVMDEGFAGPDSFVVETTSEGLASFNAFVRKGNLITQVATLPGIAGRGRTDRERGRRQDVRGARHLLIAAR